MSQTPNYNLIYCPSDNLEKYNVTCKNNVYSNIFEVERIFVLGGVEHQIFFFFFTTGITLILFPSILSDEMDGKNRGYYCSNAAG